MSTDAEIRVEKRDDSTYDVTVEAATTTEHEVQVDPVYYEELTGGDISPVELVERSFEYLLEREPNTAILRSFELPQITNYFPEYEADMKSAFL